MLFKNRIKNYIQLIIGLFVIALAVSLSIKADLGTSPIACIPCVISACTNLTVGTTTIIFNIILVLLQKIILKNDFPRIQYTQLIIGTLFGTFTDFTLLLLKNINPANLNYQIIIFIISLFVLALGVVIEVRSNTLYLPGDGLIRSVSYKTSKNFGKIKVIIDTSMVIIGFALSILFFKKFIYVGIGTIIAGIIVGNIVSFYNKIIDTIIKNKN